MKTIYQATLEMCVAFQEAAAEAHLKSRPFTIAIHYQECAARYAAEARWRLFRLIGVE